MRRLAFSFAACTAAMAVAGCDTIGNPIDALRAKKGGPDEFSVISRGELRMPPTIRTGSLPTPNPGEPSPLEPDPRSAALAALAGENALLPVPDEQGVSTGEAELLAAANVEAASPEVSQQVARRADEVEANQPYRAPTVLELLSGSSDGPDKELLLDPVSESQRLAIGGTRSPSDPDAAAPPAPSDAPQPARPFYDTATQGRAPRNTFSNTATRPSDAPRTPAATVGGTINTPE